MSDDDLILDERYRIGDGPPAPSWDFYSVQAREEAFGKVNPEMVVLARESRGMSRTQLARETGIRPARLKLIESGRAHVGKEEIERMAAALSYTPGFFYQTDEICPLTCPPFSPRMPSKPKPLGMFDPDA